MLIWSKTRAEMLKNAGEKDDHSSDQVQQEPQKKGLTWRDLPLPHTNPKLTKLRP